MGSISPGMEGDFLPFFQPSSSFPVGFPGSPDLTAEMPVCSADLSWLEESYTPDEEGIVSNSVISPVWGMKGGLDIEYMPESVSLSFFLHFSPGIRFIKKLEHTWKALVHDGVSACTKAGIVQASAGLPALASFMLVGADYLAIYSA